MEEVTKLVSVLEGEVSDHIVSGKYLTIIFQLIQISLPWALGALYKIISFWLNQANEGVISKAGFNEQLKTAIYPGVNLKVRVRLVTFIIVLSLSRVYILAPAWLLHPVWEISTWSKNGSRCFNTLENMTSVYGTKEVTGANLNPLARSMYTLGERKNHTFTPLMRNGALSKYNSTSLSDGIFTGVYRNFTLTTNYIPGVDSIQETDIWHQLDWVQSFNAQDVIRQVRFRNEKGDLSSLWSVGNLQTGLLNLDNWDTVTSITVANSFMGRQRGFSGLAWRLVVKVSPQSCSDQSNMAPYNFSKCHYDNRKYIKTIPIRRTGNTLYTSSFYVAPVNTALAAHKLIARVDAHVTLLYLSRGDSTDDLRVDILDPVGYGDDRNIFDDIVPYDLVVLPPVFNGTRQICISGQERKITRGFHRISILITVIVPAAFIFLMVMLQWCSPPAVFASTSEMLLAGARAIKGGFVRKNYKITPLEKLLKPEAVMLLGLSLWTNKEENHACLKSSHTDAADLLNGMVTETVTIRNMRRVLRTANGVEGEGPLERENCRLQLNTKHIGC